MSNRGRTPDQKELSLWAAVKRTVAPLHTRREKTEIFDPDGFSKAEPVRQNDYIIPTPTPTEPSKESVFPKHLDRKTDERLKKGKMPIEGVLDMHGMTQDQAHHALNGFVSRAFRDQKRCVLVITGKGSRSGGDGILKTQLPVWLALNPLRDIVLKSVQAHRKHGGGGAFYLYLKRQRTP